MDRYWTRSQSISSRQSTGCQSDESEQSSRQNLFISDDDNNYSSYSNTDVGSDFLDRTMHRRPHSFQSPARTPRETSPPSCRSVSPFSGTPESPFLQYELQKNIEQPGRWTLRAEYGCTATVFTNDSQISTVAATSQGMLYSGSDSTKIRAWKVPEFHELCRFKSGGGSVKAVVVDGDRLYSANRDRKIRVWRLRQHPSRRRPRLIATLPTMKDRLARSIYLQNYVRIRRHHRGLWINHVDAISSLALNPRQNLLYSASWDKTVKVWRLSDFKCLESICAHDDAVNALTLAASNELLLTGSADGTVKVWERVKDDGKHVQIAFLRRHDCNYGSAVNALGLGSDGTALYAGFSNGTIGCWNITVKADARGLGSECRFGEPRALRGHRRSVLCLMTGIVAEHNVVFSGSADGTIRVWKIHTCIAVLRGHASPVKCIALVDRDVKRPGSIVLYSGTLDGTIKEWWFSIFEKGNEDEDIYDNADEKA